MIQLAHDSLSINRLLWDGFFHTKKTPFHLARKSAVVAINVPCSLPEILFTPIITMIYTIPKALPNQKKKKRTAEEGEKIQGKKYTKHTHLSTILQYNTTPYDHSQRAHHDLIQWKRFPWNNNRKYAFGVTSDAGCFSGIPYTITNTKHCMANVSMMPLFYLSFYFSILFSGRDKLYKCLFTCWQKGRLLVAATGALCQR